MSGIPENATTLLGAASSGDQEARRKLFSVLYEELHSLAHAAMSNENPGHILQTTALIHETYLRLVKSSDVSWRDRSHFFTVAARAMRRILVSEARSRKAAKRGEGRKPVSLHSLENVVSGSTPAVFPFEHFEELDRALEKLGACDGYSRMCTIVELRFFAGLTHEEVAEVLGISKGTVRRDWEFAKVWLHQELKEQRSHAG